ncbi:hypothetical protein FOXB_17585 [Fusarium oxysporum f. sp. conglutinans Fo5176]|uniref:Uncharacterized protein n=1 Tax=Fusarium oxysporum (strain Fo5176) TaxID=660025 RepID=F9GG01_FUSOF|nr:hypothetical protein FOXB_17585 [Fusarium oxysporum f. sp. conglutinans Fo5176]
MTTNIFSLPQPPMISRVNTKLCHVDITSQHRFIEALGINAPVDINNLLTKDSTKFRSRDHQHIQYSNPHVFGEVDQSMVGPSQSFREVQLWYLVFENLAHPELKEGLRYLLQKVWTSDSIEAIRRSIGVTTEEEWKSLGKSLKGHELECANESYYEKEGLEWLVEPCPDASSKDQLLGKWQERILRTRSNIATRSD